MNKDVQDGSLVTEEFHHLSERNCLGWSCLISTTPEVDA